MIDQTTRFDAVKRNYNDREYDYEVRRLEVESPAEHEITRRWLDKYVPDGATVADIGVGVGHYAHQLAERGCRVHLVDFSERLLETATKRLHDAELQSAIIGTTFASATELDELPSKSFDAVLLLGPLYHLCTLEERQTAVAHVTRMLKADGVLFAAGINRMAHLKDILRFEPHVAHERTQFNHQFIETGLLTPEMAPPLAYAHLTTVAEMRGLFTDAFDEVLFAGVESFAGHFQTHLVDLSEENRQAWFDLVEMTATTPEGQGSAEHFLYIGRKQGV